MSDLFLKCQIFDEDELQIDSAFEDGTLGISAIESSVNGPGGQITIALSREQVEKLTEHLLIALDEF